MKRAVATGFAIIYLLSFQSLNAQFDSSNAQRAFSKYEVHAGYGLLSDMQMIAAFSDVYADVASGIFRRADKF